MFHRKAEKAIVGHLESGSNKVLLVDGARQVGKSFIIRHVGTQRYPHFVELNMLEDRDGARLFADATTVERFHLALSIASGSNLGGKDDTLVFLDEIQVYPHLLAMLKYLRREDRYTYIASGSMLGIALGKTPSIPMGSIETLRMYPLDFEEFLWAYGIGGDVIEAVGRAFGERTSLPEGIHARMLELFRYYLISGGLPDAVKEFVLRQDVPRTRNVQRETREYYAMDASQYDAENKLRIRSVYGLIPSAMESRKKRIVVNRIEGRKGALAQDYREEFDYLGASGIALEARAVSTPVYPLCQSGRKNLLKLYLNDPGILTSILYGNNIRAVLDDERSVNLGSVYETAVAAELRAHGFELYYYDNRKKGEVDFLVDDEETLSVVPIEVKSGRDYTIHAALDRFVENPDYSVQTAYVLSNEREIRTEGKIVYVPVYMVMCLGAHRAQIQALPRIRFDGLGAAAAGR